MLKYVILMKLRFIVKVVPTIFLIFVVPSLNVLKKKFYIKRYINESTSIDVCNEKLFSGLLPKAGL